MSDLPQPCTLVRVVQAVDREIYDVSGFIGRPGIVESHEVGGVTTDPDDPMIRVKFAGGPRGTRESFWREELRHAR